MTQPHFTLPKVAVQFGGKERFLCFTNRSLKRLKTDKGLDAIETLQTGEILDTLPLLLWAGFLWAEPELDYTEIEDYFLDEGGLLQNKEWALDVAEAMLGKRPVEKEVSADPPVPEAVTS